MSDKFVLVYKCQLCGEWLKAEGHEVGRDTAVKLSATQIPPALDHLCLGGNIGRAVLVGCLAAKPADGGSDS